jgi:hypothetical protein
MDNFQKPKILGLSPKQVLWMGYIFAFIWLVIFAWQYFVGLQNDTGKFWSGVLFTYISLVSAIGAAIIATMVTRQFTKGEPPYRTWMAFSIGMWFWVLGELSIVNENFFSSHALSPYFQLVDVFWLLGYFFLGLSLYSQLLAVYGVRQSRNIYWWYAVMVAAAIFITALLTMVVRSRNPQGDSWLFLFVTLLYPVLDVLEGGTAIWVSLLFGRGQWSRPWWGLILFAITDGIDAFYWSGGYELMPVLIRQSLDFISLIIYPASYMVAGLALLANYFILRYGMDSGLLGSSKKSSQNITMQG